jgi:anthranilate/para-aminobenzoate synthase component I
MQIIDELEVNKRGPYGGGIGHVGFAGVAAMHHTARLCSTGEQLPP